MERIEPDHADLSQAVRIKAVYHFALLAPVPLDHLQSGQKISEHKGLRSATADENGVRSVYFICHRQVAYRHSLQTTSRPVSGGSPTAPCSSLTSCRKSATDDDAGCAVSGGRGSEKPSLAFIIDAGHMARPFRTGPPGGFRGLLQRRWR
jgi:hypothetical protein